MGVLRDADPEQRGPDGVGEDARGDGDAEAPPRLEPDVEVGEREHAAERRAHEDGAPRELRHAVPATAIDLLRTTAARSPRAFPKSRGRVASSSVDAPFPGHDRHSTTASGSLDDHLQGAGGKAGLSRERVSPPVAAAWLRPDCLVCGAVRPSSRSPRSSGAAKRRAVRERSPFEAIDRDHDGLRARARDHRGGEADVLCADLVRGQRILARALGIVDPAAHHAAVFQVQLDDRRVALRVAGRRARGRGRAPCPR